MLTLPYSEKTADYRQIDESARKIGFWDIYFLVAVYLFPNMFLGMADRNWFFDAKLVEILLPIPLLFYPENKRENNPQKYLPPGWIFLVILTTYYFLQFFRSLFFTGGDIIESLRIVRWNLAFPFSTVCILNAVQKMEYRKALRLFKIIMLIFVIQSILCFISALINYDFFVNRFRGDDYEAYLEGERSHRGNALAFPKHFLVLFDIYLIITYLKPTRKRFLISLILVATPIVMTRRMFSACTIIEYILTLSLCFLFLNKKNIKEYMYGLSIPILVISIVLVAPGLKDKILLKIMPDNTKQDSLVENYGTYNIRLKMLSSAYEEIQTQNKEIIGIGYQRDSNSYFIKEGYSFVLGEDSPISTILFCEGYSGIVLRLFPYIAFILWALKKIQKGNNDEKMMSIILFSYVIAQIPSYLQSMILTRFDYNYCILSFFYILLQKKVDFNSSEAILEQTNKT